MDNWVELRHTHLDIATVQWQQSTKVYDKPSERSPIGVHRCYRTVAWRVQWHSIRRTVNDGRRIVRSWETYTIRCCVVPVCRILNGYFLYELYETLPWVWAGVGRSIMPEELNNYACRGFQILHDSMIACVCVVCGNVEVDLSNKWAPSYVHKTKRNAIRAQSTLWITSI